MKKEIRNSYKYILSLTKDFFPEKIPLIWENMKGNRRKSNNALSNVISKVKASNITLAVNIFAEVQNKEVATHFLLSAMKVFEMELPDKELIYNDIKNSITLQNAIPYLAYYTYKENIENCNNIVALIEEFKKTGGTKSENDKLLIPIEQLTSDSDELKIKNKELSTQLKEKNFELNNFKKKFEKQEKITAAYEKKNKLITEHLLGSVENAKRKDEKIKEEINKNKQLNIEINKLKSHVADLLEEISIHEKSKSEYQEKYENTIKQLYLSLENIKQKDEIIDIETNKNKKLIIDIENLKLQRNEKLEETNIIESRLQKSKKIFLFGENRGLTKIMHIDFIIIERKYFKISKVKEYLDAEKSVYVVLTEIPADFKFAITKFKNDNEENNKLKIFKDKQELLHYIK